MLGGPGVLICGPCLDGAEAVLSGKPPAVAPRRPGWGRGRMDADSLAGASPAELRAELEAVSEIAAPLLEYIEAANRRLTELGDSPRPPRRRHHHRTAVVLPDGTTVTAVSFDATGPYHRDVPPDFGLYLDELWDPPWPHEHVAWPDFGLPADLADATEAFRDLLIRARRGEAVEIGCLGGHGRTGTAVACLAVLAGAPADEAVAWVRDVYCPLAVETDEQVAFVAAFSS
jgi:hypothetical protein